MITTSFDISTLERKLNSFSESLDILERNLKIQSAVGPVKVSATYAIDGSFPTRCFKNEVIKPFKVLSKNAKTNDPFHDTDDLAVSLRVLTLQGSYADDLLHPQNSSFRFRNGEATIEGLRFIEVSSTHGLRFILEVYVTNQNNGKQLIHSFEPTQVVSERLKNAKKSVEDLRPDDGVDKLDRVGREFKQRFNDAGVKTIRDLARVGPQTQILKERKDRSSMTSAQLESLIKIAKQVVLKHDNSMQGDGQDMINRFEPASPTQMTPAVPGITISNQPIYPPFYTPFQVTEADMRPVQFPLFSDELETIQQSFVLPCGTAIPPPEEMNHWFEPQIREDI